MKVYSQQEVRHVVEEQVRLVEKYYPDLRFTDRYEWNHKVAFLSNKITNQVGQKSTSPSHPISEDTIGILSAPREGAPGSNLYPQVFEAVDLVRGSDGVLQWLSFGMVTQNYVFPLTADVSNIPDVEPIPEPTPDPLPFPGYEELGGDALCREVIGEPLAADYIQAHNVNPNQPLIDSGVSVWTNRSVWDALYWIMVEGMEPRAAYTRSAEKRRPEWRDGLGLPPL